MPSRRYLTTNEKFMRNVPLTSRIVDLRGKRYGRLQVIELSGVKAKPNGKLVTIWQCKCVCGTVKDVYQNNLGTSTNSCGCLMKDIAAERSKRNQQARRKSLREATCLWREGVYSNDEFFHFLNGYVLIHQHDRVWARKQKELKDAGLSYQVAKPDLRGKRLSQAPQGTQDGAAVRAPLGDAANSYARKPVRRSSVM